ncbi:MAG: hypothetical protein IPH81_08940 [Candidatus Microthrix sp.]|nr:hypothetical protein [Candidatus Microthrix sp.]
MHEFDVRCDGPHRLDFWVLASSFCHHQVRSMVGTLVQVGEGRRNVDSVARALESLDRQQCGPVAPGGGIDAVAGRLRMARPSDGRRLDGIAASTRHQTVRRSTLESQRFGRHERKGRSTMRKKVHDE